MDKRKWLLLGAMMASSLAWAGDVSVRWEKPDDYTDIRPTNESRDGFRDRVCKELGKVFEGYGKKLPDGVKLEITVLDLDLAGDVRPMMHGNNDIRIVKDIYWPRMTINYVLKDASGKVLSEATKEEIKDMNFLMASHIPTGNTSLFYEEKMLDDWFRNKQRSGVFPKLSS